MADDKVYTSRENGALFIQPDGPNSKPQYLGCYDVDDFDEDKGSINALLQCFDVDNPGSWKTLGYTTAPPSTTDIGLGTYVGKTADALENVSCPFTLFLHLRCDGKADLFTNYERSLIAKVGRVSSHGRQGWVKRSEDTAAMQTFTAQVLPPFYQWFRLKGYRQSTTETEALNDIAFCNEEKCQGVCGAGSDICQDGSAVGDAQGGSPSNVANVLDTDNGGSAWAATATNPFAAAENISAIVCFASPTGQNVTRKIVARGTTDAGNPAEIAWSEDDGATWTNVDVGSTNGQYVANDNALFALDFYNIWLATQDGYIYYSDDGGATWTAQESGVIHSGIYHSIFFANDNVGFAGGAADVVAVTVDGGSTWSAATATGGGGDILGLWAHDSQRVFATTDDGDLYYSLDQATTWTQRTELSVTSGGTLDDIEFANEYIGAVIHNVGGAGTVYATFDGGYTWEALSGPTNSGLNSIVFCASNLLFAVGEVQGSTALIAKYTPAV